jgi:uncharacterized protein (TIGR02246 family)
MIHEPVNERFPMTSPNLSTNAQHVASGALDLLETAWNDADGAAFGRAYGDGASFVTIRGEHIVGSANIGAGHDGIFHTIYAGSRNRMVLIRAEEVTEGVILAVSLNTLDCPAGPLAGRHRAMSTSVIARTGHRDSPWQIVSTHNTLVTA